MKYRSYNKEFKIATAQFIDLFNDIRIDRRNSADEIQQIIRVPAVFGNRSRILKSLENRNKTLKIPLIVVSMGNFSRDVSRVHSVNDDLINQIYDGASNYDSWLKIPTPININYTVEAITKYQEDIDEILTNFIPFFNPDVYVVWPHPKNRSVEIRSQVVWDGNCNITYPIDVTETDPYRIIASMEFTYKTWVFAGMGDSGIGGPLIHRINFCPNIIPIGEEGYGLDRWYEVPTHMTFDAYKQNIICGLIIKDNNRENYDWLRIFGTSGTIIDGYWNDISGLVTGEILDQIIEIDPCYLVTNNDNQLLLSDISFFSKLSGMEAVNYPEFYDLIYSGELSSCTCFECIQGNHNYLSCKDYKLQFETIINLDAFGNKIYVDFPFSGKFYADFIDGAVCIDKWNLIPQENRRWRIRLFSDLLSLSYSAYTNICGDFGISTKEKAHKDSPIIFTVPNPGIYDFYFWDSSYKDNWDGPCIWKISSPKNKIILPEKIGNVIKVKDDCYYWHSKTIDQITPNIIIKEIYNNCEECLNK